MIKVLSPRDTVISAMRNMKMTHVIYDSCTLGTTLDAEHAEENMNEI